jgi:hypothetical protein
MEDYLVLMVASNRDSHAQCSNPYHAEDFLQHDLVLISHRSLSLFGNAPCMLVDYQHLLARHPSGYVYGEAEKVPFWRSMPGVLTYRSLLRLTPTANCL